MAQKKEEIGNCYNIWHSHLDLESVGPIISIDPNGKISHIGFPNSHNHQLCRCIANVIYKLQLPPTQANKVAKIQQMLNFKRRR